MKIKNRYILFHKDHQQPSGTFVRHYDEYSKILQCHIHRTLAVGIVKCQGRRFKFQDYKTGRKAQFPSMEEAVEFGRRFYNSYRFQVANRRTQK